IALDKQQVTEAKQEVKQGEKMLEQLRREQDVLQKLSEERKWQEDYQLLQEKQRLMQQATALLSLWKNKKAQKAVLDVSFEHLFIPVRKNTMGGLLETWKSLVRKKQALEVPLKVLTMPVHQAQHPKILAVAWKKAHAKFQWFSEGHTGPDLVLPTRQPKASLLWGRWKSALRKQNILA